MKSTLSMLLPCAMLASCAGAPVPGELDHLPTVRFGEPIPAGKDHILLFEKGGDIPLNLIIDGGLIEQGIELQHSVTLNKSIYAYKGWVSFDGQNWRKRDELLELRMQLRIPGYFNPNPGLIHLEVNQE